MSQPNLAGEAWTEDDMTEATTRATWSEAGLRLFMARIRELYGEEFYARITSVQRVQSDAPQGDPPCVGGTTDCPTCEGPSTITGTEWPPWLAGYKHYRLDCHHLVRAS